MRNQYLGDSPGNGNRGAQSVISFALRGGDRGAAWRLAGLPKDLARRLQGASDMDSNLRRDYWHSDLFRSLGGKSH